MILTQILWYGSLSDLSDDDDDNVLNIQPQPQAMPQYYILYHQAMPQYYILYYSNLIFIDDLLQILVEETNRYAMQYFVANLLSPSARVKARKSIDKDKLKVFLGFTMLTGLVQKKGRFDSYWSKNKLICTLIFW